MNGVSYMAEETRPTTVAIISFPGEYGQDGAAGAKIAAEALGFEVVYDGEARRRPRFRPDAGDHRAGQRQPGLRVGDDQPDDARRDHGRRRRPGLRRRSGRATRRPTTSSCSAPTWRRRSTSYYFHSTYTQLWNSADVPGMDEVVAGMQEKRPDAPVSDVYIVAWTEGYITQQILEQAAAQRRHDEGRRGGRSQRDHRRSEGPGSRPDVGRRPQRLHRARVVHVRRRRSTNFTPAGTVSDEDAGTGFSCSKARSCPTCGRLRLTKERASHPQADGGAGGVAAAAPPAPRPDPP